MLVPIEGEVTSVEVVTLTPKQTRVLMAICEGLTSREAGIQLGVSSKTVEFHRARIAEKLGINTIAGLVRYAIRSGIINA